MVLRRCGRGGLGCIWRHLSWSLPWRCNFFFKGFRKRRLALFVGGVALRFCLALGRVLMVVYCCASGCFGCVCMVLELVPKVVRRCGSGYIGCRCIWTHLLQMQSGRCLGGVITSSFRASESDVRQFSWVVWRCVFVWFWGVFCWWFTVAQAAALMRLRGVGACSEGGSPLRKRLHWMQMHLDPFSPDAVWSLLWRCNNFFF